MARIRSDVIFQRNIIENTKSKIIKWETIDDLGTFTRRCKTKSKHYIDITTDHTAAASKDFGKLSVYGSDLDFDSPIDRFDVLSSWVRELDRVAGITPPETPSLEDVVF